MMLPKPVKIFVAIIRVQQKLPCVLRSRRCGVLSNEMRVAESSQLEDRRYSTCCESAHVYCCTRRTQTMPRVAICAAEQERTASAFLNARAVAALLSLSRPPHGPDTGGSPHPADSSVDMPSSLVECSAAAQDQQTQRATEKSARGLVPTISAPETSASSTQQASERASDGRGLTSRTRTEHHGEVCAQPVKVWLAFSPATGRRPWAEPAATSTPTVDKHTRTRHEGTHPPHRLAFGVHPLLPVPPRLSSCGRRRLQTRVGPLVRSALAHRRLEQGNHRAKRDTHWEKGTRRTGGRAQQDDSSGPESSEVRGGR